MHDCFRWPEGQKFTSYQDEILGSLIDKRRVAARGPRGLGKTAIAALAVLWFATTREGDETSDWKVPTTASSWRQLTRYLWPEIHKWAGRIRWDRIGREAYNARTELLVMSIQLKHGQAFAGASDNPETMEGAHADSLLYIFDEAKIIPNKTFDAVEGAFSGAGAGSSLEAYALATSTPGVPVGRFYDICSGREGTEHWTSFRVTFEDAVRAGRMTQEWADQMKAQWGEDSTLYRNQVRGEFASEDTDGVIPLAWIEAANERWQDWKEAGGESEGVITRIGADIARSGDDKTVFAIRKSRVISELRRYAKQDTMATTGLLAGILKANPQAEAVVDVVGVGSGVVDRLRELGLRVVPFNAGEKSLAFDRSGELGMLNKRAEAWWNLREMLEPNSNEDLALPPDTKLMGDLTSPKWKATSGGRIQVESKDEVRKRLGRSTDDADACIQAFLPKAKRSIGFG